MQHLQRLIEGVFAPAEVNKLLREKTFETVDAVKQNGQFPALGTRARGIMELVQGYALGHVLIARAEPKKQIGLSVSSADFNLFFLVLQAQPSGVMVMSGDESTAIKIGDVWWARVGEQEGMLINNSDDDCIVMFVEVRVDP